VNNSIQGTLKWEVQQRLTLLEATAFWSGAVSTQALTGTFHVSRIQASKDIALYLSFAPDNMRYDRSLKRYVITENFRPLFMQGAPREYLQVLQAHAHGGPVVALAANLPAVAVLEPPARQLDLDVLRLTTQAARFGWELEIEYQSMTRLQPAVHRVSPHTLAFTGLRWHMRAFSESHNDYRDFVLARILRVENLGRAFPPPFDDDLWEKTLTVRIGPHPGLSTAQRAAIERDYGMRDGKCETAVKAALLPYFLQLVRIGGDDIERHANEQQVVLLNREELQGYIGF
jgi:predicted DNA-binding transcriptional regulator YafY